MDARGDDLGGDIAQIETGLVVFGARAGDNLAEE